MYSQWYEWWSSVSSDKKLNNMLSWTAHPLKRSSFSQFKQHSCLIYLLNKKNVKLVKE